MLRIGHPARIAEEIIPYSLDVMVDAQRKDLDKIKLDMDECRKKLQNQKIPSAVKVTKLSFRT